MNKHLEALKAEIAPYRQALIAHPVYSSVTSLAQLHTFMQHHVFAVWDFMSLLKSLQTGLTCTAVPWVPRGSAQTRYLINEIVIGEESDVDEQGVRMSHYELYLRAMQQSGADTVPISAVVAAVTNGTPWREALAAANGPEGALRFTQNTLETATTAPLHVVAAVFTYGREDIIPGMFMEFVKELNRLHEDKVSIFQYYLERHIEVDGDHHSHLAEAMTVELCGDNEHYWQQATKAVIAALQTRIALWDAIVAAL